MCVRLVGRKYRKLSMAWRKTKTMIVFYVVVMSIILIVIAFHGVVLSMVLFKFIKLCLIIIIVLFQFRFVLFYCL